MGPSQTCGGQVHSLFLSFPRSLSLSLTLSPLPSLLLSQEGGR